MKLRKAKTDGERLIAAVSRLEKLKAASDKDPWGFIGSVILMYHAMKNGAKVYGQSEVLDSYERNLLSTTTFELPAGVLPPKREEPYR